MSNLAAQIEALASSPPTNPTERQTLYNATKKLSAAIEDPFNTIYRVNGSPMILTFSHVASELGILKSLADSPTPISGTDLAKSSNVDRVLLGRILRFLASNELIVEAGEDVFAANAVTRTLARPGFQAGMFHAFSAIMPCLQATPKFLADTKYINPADVLHSPFQIAHNTNQPAFVWAMGQPKLMAEFNLWMSELHDGQQSWLDVFDFPSHIGGSSAETLVFVDIGGGIGQQCALLKSTHSQMLGRVVLQEQPFVLPHAIPIEGVEKESYDFWTEQPIKGAKVYYLRNILHDYPNEKAITIIHNTVPALSPESLLIIDEMIIPNTGAHPRATEQDMVMMVSLASTERTENQWDDLLEKAGLKIINKSTYNAATGESIIVTVPK